MGMDDGSQVILMVSIWYFFGFFCLAPSSPSFLAFINKKYIYIYISYCGQSAINELADGIVNGEITSLEQLNRRMRGRESDLKVLDMKLQVATSIAIGLAHVHNSYIFSGDPTGSTTSKNDDPTKYLLYGNHTTTTTTATTPTMAHYDINPRNIAIMSNGQPKLNDFNIAEFLTYHPSSTPITTNINTSCGFRSRLHEPWWRAPEEMDTSHTAMVTEKVDVYALGNVLFHILTTHAPRGKMKLERMEQVRQDVRKGIRPTMLEPYDHNGPMRKHRIVQAFLKAMDLCFHVNPSQRGTAIQVAKILHQAWKKREKETRGEKKTKRGKEKKS
jgi:serine/threonine protein kinase